MEFERPPTVANSMAGGLVSALQLSRPAQGLLTLRPPERSAALASFFASSSPAVTRPSGPLATGTQSTTVVPLASPFAAAFKKTNSVAHKKLLSDLKIEAAKRVIWQAGPLAGCALFAASGIKIESRALSRAAWAAAQARGAGRWIIGAFLT